MKVFISPPEETDWAINVDELAAAIGREYDAAEITKKTEGAHSLEWTLGFALEGSLDQARNTVVIDGEIEQCAYFAVWYRKLVPQKQSLVFFDESYSADVMLGSDTMTKELLSLFIVGEDAAAIEFPQLGRRGGELGGKRGDTPFCLG